MHQNHFTRRQFTSFGILAALATGCRQPLNGTCLSADGDITVANACYIYFVDIDEDTSITTYTFPDGTVTTSQDALEASVEGVYSYDPEAMVFYQVTSSSTEVSDTGAESHAKFAPIQRFGFTLTGGSMGSYSVGDTTCMTRGLPYWSLRLQYGSNSEGNLWEIFNFHVQWTTNADGALCLSVYESYIPLGCIINTWCDPTKTPRDIAREAYYSIKDAIYDVLIGMEFSSYTAGAIAFLAAAVFMAGAIVLVPVGA